MAVQFSVASRNARLQAHETAVGASPILRLVAGAVPASCAAADPGAVLASLTLPADWQGAPSAGASALAGTWSGTGAAAGTIGHYRIYASDGVTCHEQGTCTATGGGGDMTFDNLSIAVNQPVTITGHTLTDGNA